MDECIATKLVERGERLFHAPATPVVFTQVPHADALVNNLAEYPHAFLLACVMDRL